MGPRPSFTPPAHTNRTYLPQFESSKSFITSYVCLVTSAGVQLVSELQQPHPTDKYRNMETPSKLGLGHPSAASSTRSLHSISMIRVLKVIHHFICEFCYFNRGPNWPLSCNNPPNGQISPHGDTKQMRPRPSFRQLQHTPTSLFFHDSSSQSHPLLHMCVWLLQQGS